MIFAAFRLRRSTRYDFVCDWLVQHVPGARFVLMALSNIWHSIFERLAEWMLTGFLLAWGIALTTGGTFLGAPYSVLVSWANEGTWALFCLVGGGARLALLIINGAWKRSPHFRAAASLGTIPFWLALSSGFYLTDLPLPSIGIYALCVVGEVISALRALREAGNNDGSNLS